MPATRNRTQYPEQHERSAARRYLEHDHASQSLGGEPGREANRHARAIDEEHPRARDIAMTGTERELGQLPKHLKHHQRRLRQQAALSQEQVAEIRNEYRRGPYQEPGQQPQPASETPSPARRVDQGISQGVDLAGSGLSAIGDTSWGGLLMELFMGGLVLSLGYLVLKDSAAVGKLFLGLSNAARAVISPHTDPLNPKGAL